MCSAQITPLEVTMEKETFFTKDRSFYKSLFHMLIIVALQNIVAYSVNMADNIMLGSYSQNALSGAATVNQVFFMVQQFALAIGNSLVVLASQYWGENRTEPIRKLSPNDRIIAPLNHAREYGIDTPSYYTGIASVLLYNNPQDAQSVQLQKLISDSGLEVVLSTVCSLNRSDPSVEKIRSEYLRLKAKYER